MKERKIITAIKKLNAHQFEEFKKFVYSPFFNVNKKCIAYFEIIEATIKSGEDLSNLTAEKLWKATFGEIQFEDIKLRKLSSDMYNLYEKYKIQTQLKTENVLQHYLLLQSFKDNDSKEFVSASEELDRIKKINLNKNAVYYLNQYNIEKLLLEFNLKDDVVAKNQDIEKLINIDEISLNLDVFFIAEKLKYYCNLLSWNKNYNVNKKIVGIDIILKLARSPIFKDFPPIAIYNTISLTLTDENDESHFYKLRSLIDDNLYLFPREEAKEILEAALGYCITRSNKGFNSFEKEAFELYKKSIREDFIFLQDGSLSPREFRNIVFYALRMGEQAWAMEFIQNFSKFIKESERESNVNFSLARVEMYNKNYDRVIQLLATTEYKETFQAVLSRFLLLASYYELKEWDSLESLLNSFKLFLDRDKSWTKTRKLQYYNLIKFIRPLMRSNTKKDLSDLQKSVIQTDPIVNKQWLLEKINEKLS